MPSPVQYTIIQSAHVVPFVLGLGSSQMCLSLGTCASVFMQYGDMDKPCNLNIIKRILVHARRLVWLWILLPQPVEC